MNLWTVWNGMRYIRAMTAMHAEMTPSRRIGAEVRAEMARRGLSARALALKIPGVSYMWVTRRVGTKADQDITFEELEMIAGALEVSVAKILADAQLPWYDSNVQPSGYSIVDDPLFDLRTAA